jgi:hypothetical protein
MHAHNAHPHQLLRRCGSSGAHDRGPRLLAAAIRPAHWPLGGGSSGSRVLFALLARLLLITTVDVCELWQRMLAAGLI